MSCGSFGTTSTPWALSWAADETPEDRSDSEIRAADDAGRLRIGDEHVNRALLDHFRPKGFQGTLITNYGLASYVPALKDLRVVGDPLTLGPRLREMVGEHPEACILQTRSNAVRAGPKPPASWTG